MANVTGLQDRGDYWLVTYEDGTSDNVPKDLTKLVQALQTANARGDAELAAKYQGWIVNMKATGKPVETPTNWPAVLLIGGLVVGGGVLAWTFWPKRR